MSSSANAGSQNCERIRTPVPGSLPAHLERGDEPVVLAARGHPDVGDHDVGAVGEGALEQVVGVPGLGHHVEPGVREDPHDSFAQQHVVLADRHA